MSCPVGTISGCNFAQWLVDQQPKYDKLIIEDIRYTDGFIGHCEMGTFEAYTGVQHTRDRFNHVYPDTTQQWNPVTSGTCLGNPCDPTENTIGWGATRLTYALEQQSWQTPLLCFDQDMHITHARQNFRYIISDILKPATSTIMSQFIRKRGLYWVDNHIVANSTMDAFTFQWVLVGTREVYFDCNVNPNAVFKLTPQLLQRWVQPLMRIGYLGKTPFTDKRPPMLEICTDMETLWELDRLGGSTGVGGTPSVSGNWRFEMWDSASKYWMYGFTGQVGNFTARVDVEQLRFNFIGPSPTAGLFRYQVILPLKNIPSSGAGSAAGLKSVNNFDYDNAQFRLSFIWHPQIVQCLVSDATPVSPEMPFASRDFAGRWQFVMDNLGADVNGTPISNKRRNKGQFISDFKMAMAPYHTEWGVAIFHKGEPSCLPNINTCNASPGYPAQSYSSDPGGCPTAAPYTLLFTPTKQASTGTYEIDANAVSCDGVPVQHGQVTGTSTLAALVTQLNLFNVLASLGVWTVNGAQIQLVGTCSIVEMPWNAP